jgi:tRNA (adenine57-N1/adenine58-N1)-methyltransferase
MTGVSARYSLVPVAGDTVIIYITPENLSPLTLVKGAKLQNKYGTYLHDDMIGTPYGSKVRRFAAHARSNLGNHRSVLQIYSKSATRGYVFMLAFTPELWTRSLPHRTQVLYAADISMVVLQLALRPGSVVVESGTGSGSLTTSLARAVAPHGAVHTYEFNAERAAQAQEEFDRHGFGQLVTVTHADAVAEGFAATPDGAADGVFLDLPQPWAALHHAWRVLRPCGAICSFSPCIEQVCLVCCPPDS